MEALNVPHWEALTPVTQEAYRLLGKLDFIQRFYLAGGTGLALHLGHRFSIDLDFFSTETDSVGPDERSNFRSVIDDSSFPVSATRALAYFNDAEALPKPQMLGKTPWSKMKKFLEAKAYEVGRKRLEDLWE